MILQLHPPMAVRTPLGPGLAILVIDYGIHQNTCWVVALKKSGAIKHSDANQVNAEKNFTYGIGTGIIKK